MSEARTAIEEYYNEHKATRQNLDVTLNAVAALLGLTPIFD